MRSSHAPGPDEVPRQPSNHPRSAVPGSDETAATSTDKGRNYQGKFDRLTARSTQLHSSGLLDSTLNYVVPFR